MSGLSVPGALTGGSACPTYKSFGVLFCVTESVPTMKHSNQVRTIRRSVALPGSLVEELSALAPAELRGNWNRLVTVALREYATRRRALAPAGFERHAGGDEAAGEREKGASQILVFHFILSINLC